MFSHWQWKTNQTINETLECLITKMGKKRKRKKVGIFFLFFILTIESIQRPITANIWRAAGQLEGKGPGVGRQVGVAGCDVNGVGIWLLAHFNLRREDVRSIVINVQEVHLKGAGPTGGRDSCAQHSGHIWQSFSVEVCDGKKGPLKLFFHVRLVFAGLTVLCHTRQCSCCCFFFLQRWFYGSIKCLFWKTAPTNLGQNAEAALRDCFIFKTPIISLDLVRMYVAFHKTQKLKRKMINVI